MPSSAATALSAGISAVDALGVAALQQRLEPRDEAGDGRQRAEHLEARTLAREHVHDVLDEEVPERYAPQARLAVADRVEDRGRRAARVTRSGSCVEQRRDRVGHRVHQRHLDEDQRLVGQCRMEERKAPAVGLEPPAQVVPAANLVHRLVRDDLLQQVGRRAPIHADDLQEARVEPRRQQVAKVPVDGLELAMRIRQLQQSLAHAQDRGGAPGRAVEPPQQFLPRRLGGHAQLRQVGGRLLRRIRLRCREHAHGVGRELVEERRKELLLPPLVQRRVQVERDPGQRHAGRLAAFGQQFPAARDDAPQLVPVGRDGRGTFPNRFEHESCPIGVARRPESRRSGARSVGRRLKSYTAQRSPQEAGRRIPVRRRDPPSAGARARQAACGPRGIVRPRAAPRTFPS